MIDGVFEICQAMKKGEDVTALVAKLEPKLKRFCDMRDDERIFLLYYSAVHGESLLIGGYEGDATSQVNSFLKSKLPENIFSKIECNIENLYVDVDDEDNIKEKIDCCNQKMKDSGYFINVAYEDTYCAGAYFLSVVQI